MHLLHPAPAPQQPRALPDLPQAREAAGVSGASAAQYQHSVRGRGEGPDPVQDELRLRGRGEWRRRGG